MARKRLDVEHYRELLKHRRAELMGMFANPSEDEATVEADQQRLGRLSRADALQNQAMSQETLRRRRQEFVRIEDALERIEEGDYGQCLECGKLVAPARLEVDPSAALCIDCANKAES